MSIYTKINTIMKKINYLQKDDTVGTGNYAYRGLSEEKVVGIVRAALIETGLVFFPVTQTYKCVEYKNNKDGVSFMSHVDVQYKLVDIETGEFEGVCSSGCGVDTQDKGIGKAMTYAYKYALLKLFAIPSGEDTDKVHSNDLPPIVAKVEQSDEMIADTNAFVKDLIKQVGGKVVTEAVTDEELRSRISRWVKEVAGTDGIKTPGELLEEITTTDKFNGVNTVKGLEGTRLKAIYGIVKKWYNERNKK